MASKLPLYIIYIVLLTGLANSGGSGDIGKIDLIHYEDDGKLSTRISSRSLTALTTPCYNIEFWREYPFTYIINPTNPYGFSDYQVISDIYVSAEIWDVETPAELFDDTVYYSYSLYYNEDYMDGLNVISFGDYPVSNVIGVTTFWYYIDTLEIVEWDILFNTDFAFGDATVIPSVMDFRSIATHELGHTLGLGDLYVSGCSYATMYGYSQYGQYNKRTLSEADIIGLQEIYGGFPNMIGSFGAVNVNIEVS